MTTDSDHIKKGFQEYLNTHGYSFQYAVVNIAKNAFKDNSPWKDPITEFPVSIKSENTRIDLIMKHHRFQWYLVAECKRANPAIANWCFAKAPYADWINGYYAEQLKWDVANASTEMVDLNISENIYHLGAEVRTQEKGDSKGYGRGAIEEAITQLLRGYNGFIDFLKSSPSAGKDLSKTLIVPVLFTTARLWISDVNLSSADIATGNIDLSGTEFKETQWLIYQYPQSPALRHSLETVNGLPGNDLLANTMYKDYVRSIAVVSSLGIETFLKWNRWNH